MPNKAKLLAHMLLKGVVGFLLLGVLLFGSAGTLHYTNAWVLLASLGLLMFSLGLLLLIKHPETLQKRLQAKESQQEQRGYVGLIGLAFAASFILAGLDYRFAWSQVPLAVAVAAWAVMIMGYALYCVVILQNSYASRVVEIQKNQQVITYGLYAVVRHPMYLAALLLFLAMPLVLGSYLALIPMLAFPAVLVLRIKNEEAVLLTGLAGYADYIKNTKYRLIPYLW